MKWFAIAVVALIAYLHPVIGLLGAILIAVIYFGTVLTGGK